MARIVGRRINRDVSEFTGHVVVPFEILAVHHDSGPDASPDLDVDAVVDTLRAAQPPFGQYIGAARGFERQRELGRFLEFLGKREYSPAEIDRGDALVFVNDTRTGNPYSQEARVLPLHQV